MYNKESLTYSDVDKKLELDIFGIEYKINITEKTLKDIEKLQSSEEEDEVKLLKEAIDKILGEGQYETIKNKYEKDTGKELDLMVGTRIIYYIAGRIEKYFENENKIVDRAEKYENRNYRRNNRRSWRNNYRGY